MRSKVGVVFLVAIVGCAASETESETAQESSSKVAVCHVPPNEPANAHTIEVSVGAVSAHLAHGDYLGACAGCTPGTTQACYSGPAGTDGVGACHGGTQTCGSGGYGACTNEVTPTAELCGDASDGDCDGVVDEGCICTPGTSVSCYDGPAGSAGVGACTAGVQICDASGSGYGPCVDAILPAPETCGDGLDTDCDGFVDEGCVCAPNSPAACYDGPAGTSGVGICSSGTQTCNADGTGYEACAGSVTPQPESCGNALDDDCDGIVDDGCVCAPSTSTDCYEGPAGTANIGACQIGVKQCDPTGTGYGACVGDVHPTTEVCGDAVDNDCDGSADEGCVCSPNTTSACYSSSPDTEGVGTCASGSQACNATGTGYGACVGEIGPVAEVCGDALDNDCDGAVDDGCVCSPNSTSGCYGGPPGTDGVGACSSGIQTCNATGTGYGTCSGDVQPIAEICGDGIDNDCDGFTDDGCIGDRAWNDIDRDGIQDAGEAGLGGATFLLRTTSGALVAVAVSNAAGAYTFSNVPAGTYYIEVIGPAGFALTIMNAGTNDNLDSDFDDAEMRTPTFTFPANGTVDHIDAGFKSNIQS